MKKQYFLIFALLFLFTYMDAQNFPTGLKYQAVARDLSGNVLADQAISLKITLYSTTDSKTKEKTISYVETHQTITNQLGLFTLTIGQGKALDGAFNLIPWSNNEVWMGVAIDASGGNDYVSISDSKLLAVPYAIHALTASELSEQGGISRVPGNGNVWKVGGNVFNVPGPWTFGTLQDDDLVFITKNITRMTITADGDINIDNSLSVGENLDVGEDASIGNDLYVANDVHLNTNGSGATINNGDLTVANASSTDLTGTLNVDGAATLNNTLSVANSVNLNTSGGSTLINGPTTVNGATTVNNTLFVGAQANLASNVILNGGGGATTIWGTTTVNDILNVNSNGNYIANFKNTTDANGISIQVQRGTPNSSNNFVTLRNSGGGVVGRIEGQTLSELHNSFGYIWYQTMEALHNTFALAMIVVDLIGVDDADASVVEGAEFALAIAEWLKVTIQLDNNIGVSYSSGSGDYAEWLEKSSPTEVFSFGDIVGVTGGKITRTTDKADHFMVVSLSPIVLGNMPPAGEERQYEKIAFMGQVPVKVRGKVQIGDYIIPSELNDGIGIAVSPDVISLEQYKRIVGVAWTESNGKNAFANINVAVGINTNDTADRLIKQQRELEDIKINMNSIVSYLEKQDPHFNAALFDISSEPLTEAVVSNSLATELASAPFDQKKDFIISYLQENSEVLDQVLFDTRAILDQRGIDYNRYEQISRLLNDKEYFVQALKEGRRD